MPPGCKSLPIFGTIVPIFTRISMFLSVYIPESHENGRICFAPETTLDLVWLRCCR
jgi:hypothetical protein